MRTRTTESEAVPAADGGDAVQAIEVVILWGLQSVLHVSHLAPPRAFYVGEIGADLDFVIGEQALGSSRLPLVFDKDGAFRVLVPRGARAEIERAGDRERVSIEQLEETAGVEHLPEHPGARAVPIAIKFVISPSGAVANAVVQQSDVGSAKVDACIAAAVGRMDFPAPEGGGLVLVTYPFVLSQAE